MLPGWAKRGVRMWRAAILPRSDALPKVLTLFLRACAFNRRVDLDVVGRKGLLHLQCVLASSAATTAEGALAQARPRCRPPTGSTR